MQMKTGQFIADLKKQPLRSVLKQIQYSVRDSRGENMIFLHELQRRKKYDNESQRNKCGHKEKFLDNDQNQSASASDERNQIHEGNLLRLSLRNKKVFSVIRLYAFPERNYDGREGSCQQSWFQQYQ